VVVFVGAGTRMLEMTARQRILEGCQYKFFFFFFK